MRKQVVSVRLTPDLIALVDRYIELLQANYPPDHSSHIKNRSEYVKTALQFLNCYTFDELYDDGFIKGDEFDDLL